MRLVGFLATAVAAAAGVVAASAVVASLPDARRYLRMRKM
jgi:hypothetical protein